jgi:SpoVK/Ycf46/Vps4 family AAA+-type ATPase
MPTSAQLKALFESFSDSDEQRFYSAAMQIAAHEARNGHNELAVQLRELIDEAKRRKAALGAGLIPRQVPIVQPQGELAHLLEASYPKTKLADMVLSADIETRLKRIITEQRHSDQLFSHGLSPRHKFLLIGSPGTGKTMTASALAGELNLPLFIIRFEAVITKFMGESSAKLGIIFDALKKHRGVYLFDEFDTIGSMRTANNDVGEARRILNSFLQYTDRDNSSSLVLAATNHAEILDDALFRRFDDVIEYPLPDKNQRAVLLKSKLHDFTSPKQSWSKISEGLSHAELTRTAEDIIKDIIISGKKNVTSQAILHAIDEKKKYHGKIQR